LSHNASERFLNVCSRAIEAVIKVEVAEGGVKVVAPQQAYHASPEPNAFRLAGCTGQEAGSLGELVDLLFLLFGAIGWCGAGRFLLLCRLVFAAGNCPRRHSHDDSSAKQRCENTHAK
jgi:hypothetical protein